jgi:hypothetical protein
MARCYFEIRNQSAKGTESMAADIMRHLHARQYLGRAVIVSKQPSTVYTTARKQWLKLTRSIQKMRAATLNADKILKYTHTITHMQHLRFTYRSPAEVPDADIYFLTPQQCAQLPPVCFSLYITTDFSAACATALAVQLPANSLVVDYVHRADWAALKLEPKQSLEQRVDAEWQCIEQFLRGRDISAGKLIHEDMHDIEAMDDALDTLLEIAPKFMDVARRFQQALALARPLRLGSNLRESYDAVVLLAHRVQALSPTPYSQQFLESYNEDDTFFLYDVNREEHAFLQESLPTLLAHHRAAGRDRLATALHGISAGRLGLAD